MGRKLKLEDEKKVKLSISITRNLLFKIKNENLKPSRIIETLLKKYYDK